MSTQLAMCECVLCLTEVEEKTTKAVCNDVVCRRNHKMCTVCYDRIMRPDNVRCPFCRRTIKETMIDYSSDSDSMSESDDDDDDLELSPSLMMRERMHVFGFRMLL